MNWPQLSKKKLKKGEYNMKKVMIFLWVLDMMMCITVSIIGFKKGFDSFGWLGAIICSLLLIFGILVSLKVFKINEE